MVDDRLINISHRRLRWLGYHDVGRMSRDRMPLQLLFSLVYGESKSGRPSKPWADYVKEDLDKLSNLEDWTTIELVEEMPR